MCAYKEITAEVPKELREHTAGRLFRAESIGLSGDAVWISEDTVLKAENNIPRGVETVNIMRWLSGRLPVPEVIAHTVSGGKSWLLMSRVKGRMSCDEYYLERPGKLAELLAQGLMMLWETDISDCPRVRDLDTELAEARQRVESGLVTQLSEDCTFGSPAALLDWLEQNRPACEPVLSHGDFCLPNVFAEGWRISGFIDLGDCGIADRYRDLSLCLRSYLQNLDGTFGGRVYPGADPDRILASLGITPDRDKLQYYLLLDELF